MYNGKMKAITFSYDDAVTQDIRLIEIFNKYNLKSTFNLNSGFLGSQNSLIREDVEIRHDKIKEEDVKYVYQGHEVAAHTVTHPCVTRLTDWAVVNEVEQDRLRLSELAGYEVVGMAYPGGGGILYDSRVSNIIKEKTGIKYARTIEANHSLEVQENLFEFKPTCHHDEWDLLFRMGEEFLSLKTDEKKIFYVWGHAYEFDIDGSWAKFEEFLKMMSGKDDIAYLTNKEALL